MKKIKAVSLFSGGLDSLLATKLIEEQNIEVVLINFTSEFLKPAINPFKKLKIVYINITKDQLKIIKHPKFGYGSGINPCIDCKILMLKKAKAYMKKIKADFLFTGEVLGERPMTQHKRTLMLMEKKVGLKNKILRPLSAKLLPITEAEKKDFIDRNKLLSIQGRSRKIQLELAKKYNLKDFPTPAGGCILTDASFAKKMLDLIKNNKIINNKDIQLLSIGRHFRYKKSKIIVGRNLEENKKLLKLKDKNDIYLEVHSYAGPITILQNPNKESIKIAAELTARYSDSPDSTLVKYGKSKLNCSIKVKKAKEDEINKIRV